ncbi:MAG: tetrahydromethanopterin S-methyltransferase subunit A [Candidatus Aenigmatarchaeota archaeon]
MTSKISDKWPVLSGKYAMGNKEAQVAIVTIASKMDFPKEIFTLCGEMRTENLGVERIIVNTISNCNIRYIIVCGKESKGHAAGQTLIAIHENGIDANGKIIGSKGAIPFIENIPKEAVERFQRQIKKVINLIEVTDIAKIIETIKLLPKEEPYSEDPFVIKTEEEEEKEDVCNGNNIKITDSISFDPVNFTIQCD